MSRAQLSKSRADKGGKGASSQQPAVTLEIIPGKFNNHDWNAIVEQDENDEFTLEIVDEVVQAAIDIIFEAYLKKQLIPYTVTQAKDALLQIIEWQFLSRDEGEITIETDEGWQQDEEAGSAITDCWAQGSVPWKQTSPACVAASPCEVLEEDSEQVSPDDEGRMSKQSHRDEDSEVGLEPVGEETDPDASEAIEESTRSSNDGKDDESEHPKLNSPQPDTHKSHGGARQRQKRKQRQAQQYNTSVSDSTDHHDTYGQVVDDPMLSQMPASCQSILKLQAGRPPGHRDIYYDESGNVLSLTKISPDKLPSHRVATRFLVIDPVAEAAQAQLDAMRTGQFLNKKQKPKVTPRSTAGEQRTCGRSKYHMKAKDVASTVAPLPPPLLESMDVSPGVIVREGERTKHGPRQHSKRTELIAAATRRGLRPVTFRTNLDKVTVAQLLQSQSPVIRPLSETPPIPPIMPHPPPCTKPSSVGAH